MAALAQTEDTHFANGVEGLPNEASSHRKWPAAPDSPVETSTDAYRWWARDVAASLQQAVAQDVAAPKGKDSSEQVTISVLTRRIARQVALQIPKETFAGLVNEARNKMKVVEESCLDQLFNEADYREQEQQSSDPDGGPKAPPAASSQEMADILTRRIPQEMSKWIAKEIYAQLVAAGCESSSTEDDFDEEDELDDEETWRAAASARSAFDGDSPATHRDLVEAAQDQLTSSSTNVSDWISPSASTHSSSLGPSPLISNTHGEGSTNFTFSKSKSRLNANGDPERKFQLVDEAALRAEAYKKFKLVLVQGNGFRVIKHNHGGGRKTRVLKFDTKKNRICWESARVMGGEHISCTRMVKVHREGCVVYIWHMVGGLHGAVKKMVGFETQREADARILELALMHLKEGGQA